MAEPDSWEEAASDSVYNPSMANPTPAALNPSARPFTLNPSVPAFTPAPVRPSYHQPPPQQQPYPSYGYSRPPFFQSPYIQQQSAYAPPLIPVPMPAYAPVSVPAPVYAPVSTPVSGPPEIARPAPEPSQTENLTPGDGHLSEDSKMPEKKNEDPIDATMEDAEIDRPTPLVAKDESCGVMEAIDALSAVKINHAEPSQSEWQEAGNADEVVCKPIDFMEEELNHKEHLNAVFIGHVDAGKSTIGGQILYLTNMVDERTIQKYEKEAKEKSRESWYMAYIMDTNEEERAKGKTVEVGRAHFETEKRRFTILDAPGHKNYVPNMISGASQADIGVLVISARKGEFETGFERGGQTREHCLLAKTLGVSKLLVVVNKMDDPSVQWSKERFDEIEKKMGPFLRSSGYNVKKDVSFLPISGLLGVNMKDRASKNLCPWWDGPCLFEALESVEAPPRDPSGPFRMPVIDKFKDMGTVVMGKIESGIVRRGDNLIIMPNKVPVKVITVYRDNDEVNAARPGENLRIRLSGIEEEDISSGFVLSSIQRSIRAVREFDAQLQILELLDHKAIFTAGYKAVLHIHAVVEECEIMELLKQIDPKTKKPMHKKVLFVKSGAVVVARIQVNEAICVEKFEDFPQLGRFTCRDEGKTIAIGKVVGFPRVSNQE